MNNSNEEKQIDEAIEHIKAQMREELFDEWQDPFNNLVEEKNADKKFVFTINGDIVPYIEKIEPEGRNDYINLALSDRLQKDKIIKRHNELVLYAKHLFVAFITLVVGVPILFFLVNKSIEFTMKSYDHAQESFEKLYNESVITP